MEEFKIWEIKNQRKFTFMKGQESSISC